MNETEIRLSVLGKFQEAINEIAGYKTTKLKLVESEMGGFDVVIIDFEGDGRNIRAVNIECDSPLAMISDVLKKLR